ncbi:ABC transporter ATP-binding protein [Caloranaerobacter sp. DY30410]|uniref:ABC transporter ATP-binding protein n=1 Tax=Caloranaerobacter sp. DY30410 TaxID=3238305 RepID=UPI003CFBF0DD
MIYRVENLKKRYGNKEVLKGLSFEINKGEIFSILGNNGAGKTTLIKIMSNCLIANSGDVFFKNSNIKSLGNSYFKNIGVVLEGERNTYWYMTGIENIKYFGMLYGLSKSEILTRAEELLAKFNLFDARNEKVAHYSRGMHQKLSIIIGMLHKPEVLFLDEPTLGLDVLSKNILIEEIKTLSKEEKITIILTSHQLDVVEELADRVLLLEQGKIAFLDSIGELKKLHAGGSYKISFFGSVDLTKLDVPINVIEELNNGWSTIEVSDNFKVVMEVSNYLAKNECTIYSINRQGSSLEDIITKIWR